MRATLGPRSVASALLAALSLPGQTNPAIEMLDELVASETTADRRGELQEGLKTAEFATFARRLARLMVEHPQLSGLGPSTAAPWREERLPQRERIAATLHSVWRAHVDEPVHERTAITLLEILEDSSIGEARLVALTPLFRHESVLRTAAFARNILPRLDRLVHADGSSWLRASLVPLLTARSHPHCYFAASIEIARTGESPVDECRLLRRTGILPHIGELSPAALRPCLRYAFGLVRRLDVPDLAYLLATQVGKGLGIAPIVAGAPPFGPMLRGAEQHTPEYRQATIETALTWYARGAPSPPGEAVPRPFIEAHAVLPCGVRGASTLKCNSQWHSYANLALSTTGQLELGAPQLSPLLPTGDTVRLGDDWTVSGPLAAALLARLSDVSWQTDATDFSTWRAWTGSGQYGRKLLVEGELVARYEQGERGTGIAVTGALVVTDRARIGDRFGPNQKSTKATHTLGIWLPLDERGRVVGVELQDDVDLEGSYGTKANSERFTQTSSLQATGVESTPPAVERHIADLLAQFLRASAEARAGVGRELVAVGSVIRPQLLAALCAESDFATKGQLAELLRALP